MSMMKLMIDSNDEEARYRPYINTGGPIDILNGKFIPKTDGGWALSGGLGFTTAIIAEPNKFKSTLQNSCAVNALARFPDAEYHIFDSEYSSIDPIRLANMSNRYIDDPIKREQHISELSSQIKIYDPTTEKGESLDAWFDHMKSIRDFKIAHYKDFEVETEILDPENGKPYRMMMPSFVGIDSWSEATVQQMNVKNEEHTADTEMSKQRTINMEEGWQKTRLMRQLPGICAKGNIKVLMTGHMGKKFSIDGKPVKKDMAYMGQDETAKAMGPKFNFLMSSIFKISNTYPMTDNNDRKLTRFPSEEHISGTELQELDVTLVRCKNAPSGTQAPLVSSQRFGIMAGLSYFNYLASSKYYGLGSPNKVRSPFLGDMNLGRTKIFDLSRTYKVERALELTFQLFVVQNTWTLMGQPVDYSIPIDKFVESLQGSGYAIDDILNSRGWWTYKGAAGAERPYLTLPDIISIIEGKYKPKFLPVS